MTTWNQALEKRIELKKRIEKLEHISQPYKTKHHYMTDAPMIDESKPDEVKPVADVFPTTLESNKFQEIARKVAEIVFTKNKVYGNSFEESGKIMNTLYPQGVKSGDMVDMLAIVRIIDKLFRIATDKHALGENPWQDIAGYATLMTELDGR